MGLRPETANQAQGDIREQYRQARVLIDRFEVKITTACKQVGLHRQTFYWLKGLEQKKKARLNLDKSQGQREHARRDEERASSQLYHGGRDAGRIGTRGGLMVQTQDAVEMVQPETYIEDGYIIDAETGEVLGMVDALPVQDEQTYSEKLKLVDWALERRARANAHMIAKRQEMELLIAGIRERFEADVKAEERKIAWIDRCYTDLFKEVARTEIEGTTKKSTKRPWGTLKFVASKGKTEVLNHACAAAELTENESYPECLRVTIDFAALIAAAKDDPSAQTLLDQLNGLELISPTVESFDDGSTYEVVRAVTLPGVTPQIMTSLIKDEDIANCKFVVRHKPEDPLGNFGVAH